MSPDASIPRTHECSTLFGGRLGAARRVLVALGEGAPRCALMRAAQFGSLLDAELHVLRVLPQHKVSTPRALFSRHRAYLKLELGELVRAHRRATVAICGSVLEHPISEARIGVAMGEFAEAVARRAEELRAMLVVIASKRPGIGVQLTRIARRVGAPVLLARDPGAAAIVAATDLRDPVYPVLQSAAELARRFPARLIAVHNIAPMEFGLQLGWPLASFVDPAQVQSSERRLRAATQRLEVPSHGVVAREPSTVDAILDQVCDRRADLVIVGTHARSTLEGLVHTSVAAKVVERCRKSVLVLPLDMRAHA
jgi:nucleotide-binding universal stress UspA family protein